MSQCLNAPAGWSCSRVPGHWGPCAASPDPKPRRLFEGITLRDVIDAYDRGLMTKETASKAAESLFCVEISWEVKP